MRIGIGLSREKDPEKAGAAAVRWAKKTVPKPDLALVFGGIELDHAAVHRGVLSEVDGSVVLGGSSYAEITNAGVTKNSVSALLLSFNKAEVRFGQAKVAGNPFKTGTSLGGAFPKTKGLPVGLLLTAIGGGYEDELLRGIRDTAGCMPVFGGMLCGQYDLGISHADFWTNYQYAGGKLARDASRMALLDMPKSAAVGFGFEHGWNPVGPPVAITRSVGHKVYEIDGKPVFDYYRQFIGGGSEKFFEQAIQRYAFSMILEDGDLSRSILKLAVACDFKDGSIAYYPAEDLQGRQVRMIQASRRGLIAGAETAARNCQKALGGKKPDILLMVSCCTRNMILHSRMESEVDAVREVFGRDVPIFGYYSGGEIVPYLSGYQDIVSRKGPLAGSHYHTTTVGLFALSAGEKVEAVRVPPAFAAGAGIQDVESLKELLAKSEKILDNTENFLSNLSRKSYLDGEQIRVQNEIIHRYTPHEVWKQIGDNVAKGQYELHNDTFEGCFMFMDVKGFTTYSEKHSSKEVVDALNVIFKPATEIIYDRGGDVDKYIGDCIFAAFHGPDDALGAARDINVMFAKLKAKGSPFTVRIGINAGRAVRANVGAKDRREYTFIGDAVNVAQRLEANCTPGKILVSEGLFKKGKVKFSRTERREISVKGRKQAIAVIECEP